MADIREDGSEVFHYDNPDFTVSIKNNYIPAGCIITDLSIHWHEEIEITYVVSGSIHHQLNGKRVTLHAGEAIFINAKQLHLIEPGQEECELYCLIFHPMILCASQLVAQKYIAPIIENGMLDYFFLKADDEKQKKILDAIVRIHELQSDPDYEIKTMQVLYDMWLGLYGILPRLKADERVQNEELHKVLKMLSFIQKSYAQEIGLVDICREGEIGKTKGTKLFANYLNMTPVEYLNHYRLEMAAKQLAGTDLSVLEIALENGFSDSSYFARVFRKQMGKSPLEYRKDKKDSIVGK